MSEERYRICKLIIMVVFVFGALCIGGRIADSAGQLAEDGRYTQVDRMKDMVTTGATTMGYPTQVIDTRTGAVQPSVHQN
jgi:hypothetical protein